MHGLSFPKWESQNASSKNIGGGIIRIGACLEGREKADKCGDRMILDHIWEGKKRPMWCRPSWMREGMGAGSVLSLLQRWGGGSSEEQGTAAPLPAWQHSEQTLAQFSTESGRWDTACFPLHSSLWPPSPTHPLLLLFCIPPVSVLSSSLTKVSSEKVAQTGPGDDWTQLFLSIFQAHLLPSALPQTRKNTVAQNVEWQGQLAGQQQKQSQSCEQLLPFFAVHSYQVSAK